MGSEAQEALEHAEHAQHALHNPFDRMVAMTMALVAAVLALATMLSHRAHNDTLRLSAEANRLQTEANIFHTQASDAWAFYQAKNTRYQQNQAYLRLIELIAVRPGADVEKHASDWRAQVAKYDGELPKMQAAAEALVEKAHEREKESKERLEESEHVHHRAARFDLSELFVELSLVLCTLAVLAKRREFWLLGIVSGVAGIGIAATAFMIS
jgi:uncharacterized protein DUF4337